MSDIPSSVRAFLKSDATVLAAFGERIVVQYVPDGTAYPFAVIRTVSDPAFYTQDGESRRETIIQIDTFDDSLADAYTNAIKIRDALTGHSGTMGSHTVGGVFVREGQDQWMSDARHFKVFYQYVINWTVT
jgi:hypothetical protein